MAEVIRMPRMSDTMTEGNIVGWLKEEGEEVEPGETLAEVETDKATMELDSFSEGVLLHIAVKEGTVPINGVIAVIGEEGEDWKAAIEADEKSNGGGSDSTSETPEAAVASDAPEKTPSVDIVEAPAAASSDARIKASPLAKSMAAEAGINLAQIQGSGDNGRIIKRDIEAFLSKAGSSVAPPVATPTPAAPAIPVNAPPSAPVIPPFVHTATDGFEDISMSMMRKAIAKNVVANKFSAPHFYLTIEMDMEKAIESRAKMNEISPTKISFNDLVLKAAAVALRQHPTINASWLDENTIRQHQHVSIGVAVATPEGLLLPVIRNTDMKSLSQINAEVRSKAGLAKERKLAPEEMQGSTFMISNLGMFGIEEFTAIVNRPNACSMAVGAIIDKPVVKDGAVVPGKRMKVTLSCDHRVVDGATGAEFLQTFKKVMEDPIRMLV
ncbi:MAG: dihydrolipoamide acetyltransferase family protein [Bacteroidota bacterium]